MLKAVGAGGVAAIVPRPLSGADRPVSGAKNASTYRFWIGDIAAVAIVTGTMDMMPPKPPQLSETEFAAAVAALDYPVGLRLHFNVLLLRTRQGNVLIDAGPGPSTTPEYDLVTSLRAIGLTPRDISAVFLTHAHFDHLGGLIDSADRSVFSNAEHFCFGSEIDFWTSPKPDFSKLRMNPDGMVALARRVFGAVRFTRISPSTPLPDAITPILSPGHTPGHMTLEIRSGREVLYHISDLSHHAALLAHPEWPMVSDTDPDQAVATRQRTFAALAAQGTRVFGFHLPFPGIGRLKPNGAGYRWVPDLWADGAQT